MGNKERVASAGASSVRVYNILGFSLMASFSCVGGELVEILAFSSPMMTMVVNGPEDKEFGSSKKCSFIGHNV